jgi:hypothetical protein
MLTSPCDISPDPRDARAVEVSMSIDQPFRVPCGRVWITPGKGRVTWPGLFFDVVGWRVALGGR